MPATTENRTISHLNSLAFNINQKGKLKSQSWFREQYQETVNHLYNNRPALKDWLDRKRPWWNEVLYEMRVFTDKNLHIVPLTGKKDKSGKNFDPKATTVDWRDGMYDYAERPPSGFPLFLDFVRHAKQPQIGCMMVKGWFCIDADSEDSARWFRKLLDELNIQANMIVKTRRGFHFYFNGNEKLTGKIRRKIRFEGRKLDIIVDGYVTAPGFQHDTGEINKIVEESGSILSGTSLHLLLERMGYMVDDSRLSANDASDLLDSLSKVTPVVEPEKRRLFPIKKKPTAVVSSEEPVSIGDLKGIANQRELSPELFALAKKHQLKKGPGDC